MPRSFLSAIPSNETINTTQRRTAVSLYVHLRHSLSSFSKTEESCKATHNRQRIECKYDDPKNDENEELKIRLPTYHSCLRVKAVEARRFANFLYQQRDLPPIISRAILLDPEFFLDPKYSMVPVMFSPHHSTGERLYPGIMLYTTISPGHAVFIGEIKKLDASEHKCQRDRVKLFIQMKRSLDSLLEYGIDGPVVGIFVQRHRAEIWSMTLPYEALYMPTHLGSFDLILSRYYFGSVIALTPPLLAAKAAVEYTLTRIKEGTYSLFPKDWRRRTYHSEPMVLNDDISMKNEARALRQEANAIKSTTTKETDIENGEDKENRENK
ncbi:hypothetical protein FBU30_004270 [Linnemannia zychae]|nr:hypothetical protein FBU30_004270 [Linnemannia zychae]